MRGGDVVLDLPRVGSIAYTAPERLRGGSGDRRSDVWSLGVMLWEALAHVRLFEGTTDEALRKAVESAEIVPVNEMNANVPAELGAICTKALARDPAGRYQSAKVMAAEISAVLDDAGYPEGTDAIATWIAKELPVAPVPLSIPPSAAVPAPLQPTPSKLHNQTMMGLAPFGQELKPPVLPAAKPPVDNKTQPLTMIDIIEHRPATPSVIPLDNPIIPLDVKKGSGHGPDHIVHDTLPDVVKPAFLERKPEPGNVTKGWEVVPEPSEPKPEVKADPPRAKSDSKSSLPSWATRPGSTPPSATPAQPITSAVPFSPSQTLQGISNPGIKPPIEVSIAAPASPASIAPNMKLPDAPPGATVSAHKPFNTTSIVGSAISNAIPGVPAAFSGNRTATMGSNAIIEAVNASVSAGNPPVAVVAAPMVPAAPVLPSPAPIVAAPVVASVVVAPLKISEAETVNTPAVTLPPPVAIPKTPDIRTVSWDDGAKKASSSAAATLEKPTTPNTAIAKLPPPADDDFAEKETSSTSGSTASAQHRAIRESTARGDRTNKGDLLAGWGVSTAEHEALRDGDDDPFEADQRKAKKRLFMIMGGAVAAVVIVIVIAFAMSSGKKEEDPVAKSTTPIGDPTQAGGGQLEPPKQEPPKQEPVVEPPKQDGSNGSAAEPPKQEPVPEPKQEPAITKVEPPEPKQPDPVIIKPEPKKPDPVVVKKPEPKKPDPVAVKPGKVDAATAYKAGFQLYVKGDTNGALTSFKEALASNPGYAPTWRGIGLVYEKLGRKSQAVTAFKRYLELSPGAGDGDQIRNRLEKLGS